MTRYLLRRALISVVLAWLVLTATFAVLHIAPGDPVDRYIDTRVPRAQTDHLRALYGLDRPVHIQYAVWLRALISRGELGISFLFQQPVAQVIFNHLPPTLLLGACALLVQYGLGMVVGVAAAMRPGSAVDQLLRFGGSGLYAMPTFWSGLMMILLLSSTLGLLPPGGMSSPFFNEFNTWQRLVDVGHHLLLPALVLGLPMSAAVARLLRNSLLEELGKEYTRVARAQGLSNLRVALHAVPNALAPVLQLTTLSFRMLVGGALVVEHVFSWPGLGSITVNAIAARDYPLVLGTTLVSALAVLLGSFVADAAHAWVDPRVRLR